MNTSDILRDDAVDAAAREMFRTASETGGFRPFDDLPDDMKRYWQRTARYGLSAALEVAVRVPAGSVPRSHRAPCIDGSACGESAHCPPEDKPEPEGGLCDVRGPAIVYPETGSWPQLCHFPHGHGGDHQSEEGGRWGSRSVDDLIEASSLGTPEAKAARESEDPERARRIVERANALSEPVVASHVTLAHLLDRLDEIEGSRVRADDAHEFWLHSPYQVGAWLKTFWPGPTVAASPEQDVETKL